MIKNTKVSDNRTIRRLQLIKDLILLEDLEDIESQIAKLRSQEVDLEIQLIIDKLDSGEYSSAMAKIESFISSRVQLSVYQDPEIAALKLEIKVLENELDLHTNEKNEIEKSIHDFSILHHRALGDLIRKILKIKLERLEKENSADESKEQAYKEAKRDYRDYNEEFEEIKKEVLMKLNDQEKEKLKRCFRKASMLCHPDKVSDDLKVQAQEMFLKLKKAYDENDLDLVKEIFEALQSGKQFQTKGEQLSTTDLLVIEIKRLKDLLKATIQAKNELIKTEVYQIFIGIDNLNEYFEDKMSLLKREFESLQKRG